MTIHHNSFVLICPVAIAVTYDDLVLVERCPLPQPHLDLHLRLLRTTGLTGLPHAAVPDAPRSRTPINCARRQVALPEPLVLVVPQLTEGRDDHTNAGIVLESSTAMFNWHRTPALKQVLRNKRVVTGLTTVSEHINVRNIALAPINQITIMRRWWRRW